MTRIVAGTVGGRRLVVPAGDGTRPTTDRVREALFSWLEARNRVAGAHVLDLYAGSGALGLEAASRGAASVVLVESGVRAADAARRNVATLGLARVTVVLASVERYLAGSPGTPADLVFLDPPYRLGEETLQTALTALLAPGRLAADASVVVERGTRAPEPPWPGPLRRDDVRRYGETSLWIARRDTGG